MSAEKLDFAATTYKQASGTDGINDWMEIAGSPPIEVFRVTSNEDGDWLFCQKINRIKNVLIQNHGTTFATGADMEPPKIAITQGSATGNAKITITHATAAREEFSILVIGEL